MTALKKYQRLDSTGLWRESPEAQRRDVMVSFGDASLIIRDRTDTALTHWSLPAIRRCNPGIKPAIFDPGEGTGETLEVEDDTLIDAIESVRKTIERHKPHQGRLRLMTFVAILGLIIALGAFWLPGALLNHTVSAVPESTRSAIGNSLLTHVTRLTGSTCDTQLGAAALNRLETRIGLDADAHVLSDSPREMLVLPGRLILIDRSVVEDHDSPEVSAGYLLAGAEAHDSSDPLARLLSSSGMGATFQLLTTGTLDDDVLQNYARTLLELPPETLDADRLLARFAGANIPSSPYGYAVDVTGETTLTLIEADPMKSRAMAPVLADGDWVSLQSICGG